MLTFILWIFLAIISFPLALAVLVLYPFIWLLLLPFKLLGFTVGLVFDILRGIILFPFKILHII
ncbi:MAG: hypothetical protein WAR79_05230 [Melioribacteraceae bacterium]